VTCFGVEPFGVSKKLDAPQMYTMTGTTGDGPLLVHEWAYPYSAGVQRRRSSPTASLSCGGVEPFGVSKKLGAP